MGVASGEVSKPRPSGPTPSAVGVATGGPQHTSETKITPPKTIAYRPPEGFYGPRSLFTSDTAAATWTITNNTWSIDTTADFDYTLEMSLPDGTIDTVQGVGSYSYSGQGTENGAVFTVPLEITSFDLSGVLSSGVPFLIRESPTLPSFGEATFTLTGVEVSPGFEEVLYEDSQFIATELSLDGGATWYPLIESIPEPSSLLLIIGVAGGLLLRRQLVRN